MSGQIRGGVMPVSAQVSTAAGHTVLIAEGNQIVFGRGPEVDLAANDPDKPPALSAGVTPKELAAWTAVSRVLLNLDETMTKQ